MDEMEEKEIGKILQGYQPACVLMAANGLRIFDELAGQPVAVETVADKLKLSPKGVDRLLHALAGMGIVEKKDGRFRLPERWRKYLTQDGERSMQQWIQLVSDLLQPWLELPKFVKTGKNIASVMDMLGNDPVRMRAFIDAMHDKALKAAWLLAREIPIGEARHMLDVGGGPGTYSLEWAKIHNHLKATIFDIPPVLTVARDYIARYGMQDRVDTRGGDFHKDDLGSGYDLVLLANVLHMYSEELGKSLVKKTAQALVPGGRIVIHGFCTDDDGSGPLNDVLFNINIGLLTPEGRSHPVKQKIQWLEEAGARDIRHFRIDAIPTGVITGTRK